MRPNCVPLSDDTVRNDAVRNDSAAILALLSFAMLIVSLDQYIVVVALPDIARDLGYSPQTLQAVISAYAVASSGFLLFGGRAADLLGRRRMLVTGLALYAVASLAGGLATGSEVQLAARAVQGLGGALVFPGTLALINTTFAEGRDRNRALGVWGGSGAAGLVVGVLLGGVLTRFLGWEAVFFVNVPLAGAALIGARNELCAPNEPYLQIARSRGHDHDHDSDPHQRAPRRVPRPHRAGPRAPHLPDRPRRADDRPRQARVRFRRR